jgi:hypothetical protein
LARRPWRSFYDDRWSEHRLKVDEAYEIGERGLAEVGLQWLIDRSPTYSRRAASAIVISPTNTLSTIGVFCSAGITGGLPMSWILLRD